MHVTSAWEAPSQALSASAPFRRLRAALPPSGRRPGAEPIEIVRLPVPAAAWVLELLRREYGRPLFVVVPHESSAVAWLESVHLFGGRRDVVYFPAPSLSPYQDAEIPLHVRAEEAVAVDRILRSRVQTVITTPRALFRRLPPPAELDGASFEVAVDEEHPPETLVARLLEAGYRRSDLVVEVGQLAVRGGVFDVYPPGRLLPIRLDLFGDTVESIHEFDPESQRSGESLDRCRLVPLSFFPQGEAAAELLADLLHAQLGPGAGEDALARVAELRDRGSFDGWEHYLPLLSGESVTLLDTLKNALVVTLDHESIAAEVESHRGRLENEHHLRAAQGRLALHPEVLEHPAPRVRRILENADIHLGDLLVSAARAIDFGGRTTEVFREHLARFPHEVDVAAARGDRVLLVAPDDHREPLRQLLEGRDVALGPGGVELVPGELGRGFQLPGAGITVYGARQLLRRSPIGRRAKRRRGPRYGPFLSSLRDLKIGDYIVHTDHGIGQFVAVRKIGPSGEDSSNLPPELRPAASEAASEAEVMEIVYAGQRRLLLPLARLDQIQKYSGIEGIAPRLDKLGGSSWTKTKQRIKRGMRDMAKELLELYAQRQLARAPGMTRTSELQQQFDAAFVHEETPDQLDAIEAIRSDLEKQIPMDRLLCGDVGFGKTEVAMRAALMAVDNGYQVAVLAPTTILADQHLETFRARFRSLAVEIEMISRFRTPAEVREIRKQAEAGNVDILIGTHRLLSKDIILPKLGLVVIDEEQRFGVAHKEKLKQLKKDVHVLAMSATPVPRTLQLSLAGVRDLSLIETPPRDRMAVETAIVPFDSEFVREALEYEIDRGGQIYYVYNRVESIEEMAIWLRGNRASPEGDGGTRPARGVRAREADARLHRR